jgi:hypothetical protein
MGEEGSESPPISQGNRRESPNLAHKLALFDVSTLWGSLDDEDKIATLLFWESLQRGRVGQ